MSLKLLAVPFLVICTLVIAISYVKPDISILLKKQHQVGILQAQLVSLETIESNIKSMRSQITTSSSDSESTMTDADFLRQVYFPIGSDIEKGVDQLNFLADQSGIVVSDVQVEDQKKDIAQTEVKDETLQTSADLLIAKKGDAVIEEVPLVSVHRTYTPRSYLVTLKTAGSYQSTKDFYARVVQAKRFFLPQNVEIISREESKPMEMGGADQKEVPPDTVFSTLEVQFFTLPAVSLATPVGEDVFEKAQLNFATLAMIRQNPQGVTPELPAANPLGETNLFIK